MSLAEVGLVLCPRRAFTPGPGHTALAANASITPGASTGSKGLRSCHGHHPLRRGRTAKRRPAAGGSFGSRRDAPPQHTPRTWATGPRRIPAETAIPGAQAEAPRAPGLPRPAPRARPPPSGLLTARTPSLSLPARVRTKSARFQGLASYGSRGGEGASSIVRRAARSGKPETRPYKPPKHFRYLQRR